MMFDDGYVADCTELRRSLRLDRQRWLVVRTPVAFVCSISANKSLAVTHNATEVTAATD